jgi:hypothetical protein
MGEAGRSRRVAIAILACACAAPATSPETACLGAVARAPLPSASCLESDEGQRHAGLIASAIADALMGYHSHPGSAELSVGFGDDASVAFVCSESGADSTEIERRLPRAEAQLRELPAGPDCFAGRRLDFAWESPEVTHEHVRQAVRECRRRVEKHRRRNLFCHEMWRCPVEEVRERWDRGDRELRSCVLEKVPLEMHLDGSAEAHHFVPVTGAAPDPDRAIQAMELCEAQPDRETLIDCMRRHGWEPRP